MMRSLAVYEAATHRRLVTSVSIQLARAWARTGKAAEAFNQLTTAATRAAGQHDLRGKVEIQGSLALLYLDENQRSQARHVAQEALTAAERLGDATLQADALLLLASVQAAYKQSSAAAESYEHAIALLQEMRDTSRLQEAYARYSEHLEQRGNSTKAFEMLKLAYKSTQHGKQACQVSERERLIPAQADRA